MKFQVPILLLFFILCVIAKKSTSKNKTSFGDKTRYPWKAEFNINGKKQKSYFGTEFDVTKNLHDTIEVSPQNTEFFDIENQDKNEKTSQYKGVYWHKLHKKWYVIIRMKDGKQKYGGMFKDELDAAKRVKKLYEELNTPLRNPAISPMSNQQYETKKIQYEMKEKRSKYKGIAYNKLNKKWYAQIQIKGENRKYGGTFSNELDAAKRVNQLCENYGISQQNPTITATPNEEYSPKTPSSQYKGVCWHQKKRKWYVTMSLKGRKKKYGGMFHDELDAGIRVNQLCEELKIPLKNPTISTMPNEQYQKKEKVSQYTSVYWHNKSKKWYVRVALKDHKQIYGGIFNDELDAAKRVNELCEDFGVPQKNPSVSAVPNQQHHKTLLNYGTTQAELTSVVKLLDKKNDPSTPTIRKILIAAMKYREQAKMEEINLRTKNGESALSIAAKYGFSNAVKFFISKGADKEHFTNKHHTPLSLAVSENHLKVVQILFKDWISPNSHEKPYLHLSPIFNVKSREIAQLLIDNDAVTHDIYNNKHQSPLTVACQNGYLDVVEFFLDDGLDINHFDSDNKTSLFYAFKNNHHNVVNLLISKGAIV